MLERTHFEDECSQRPHGGKIRSNNWSEKKDHKLICRYEKPRLKIETNKHLSLNKLKEDFPLNLSFPFVKNKMKLPMTYLKFLYSGLLGLMIYLIVLA